jgi:HAE1 family hydrophobic/amphiphilic exporter-1
MSSRAAVPGTLAFALGVGAGAASGRPLGLAVVGGLLVSQTLTLYLTPVFYTYMEGLSGLLSHRRAKQVVFERPRESGAAGASLRH